ncbi:hypothetical protein GT370_20450 [Acidocella sp. MX-AZ03]|uniref:hypothetical protein n=1 Tax=Acidocella sp. MX-AZ03 TaxID=2697363 RepID=UPI0022DDFEC3|nr:hypothetical protein [Acidocella sp. MX-AZ03]WBO59363.1 hypothetical protein GT370_20450 [Acidocella sp. MX-AZ03]
MDLGALDQLDSKGAECIICTEDRGKGVIESAINQLLLSDRVKVISYNGINNAGSAVAIKAMCDLLPQSPKIVIHRDRDFLTEAEVLKWGADYISRDMTIFSPPLCDVETYHCSIEQVAKVYEISKQKAEELVEKAFSETLEELKTKFREKRREAIQKFWRDGGGPTTQELWGDDQTLNWNNIYGKGFIKTLNKLLPESLGYRGKICRLARVQILEISSEISCLASE